MSWLLLDLLLDDLGVKDAAGKILFYIFSNILAAKFNTMHFNVTAESWNKTENVHGIFPVFLFILEAKTFNHILTSVGTTGDTGDTSPVAFSAQGTSNAFSPVVW